jgi:hypothetical protein
VLTVTTIATTVTAVGAAIAVIATAVTMAVERSIHRWHLAQAIFDLQRFIRLDRRLCGCVTELTSLLAGGVAWEGREQLPGSLAGHAVYLYGIRDECDLFTSRAAAHGARLRWPIGSLGRAGLTARRCNAAQDALQKAALALQEAVRCYEIATIECYIRKEGVSASRSSQPLSSPLYLLTAEQAQELVRLRRVHAEAMRLASEHLQRPKRFVSTYRSPWPVLQSELPDLDEDPYSGEARPLSREVFGPTPILHIDAQ